MLALSMRWNLLALCLTGCCLLAQYGPARALRASPDDPLHPDVLYVINVTGEDNPRGNSWSDSYSVGTECYCKSTFDHDIGTFMVQTVLGWKSIREICDLLGPGPGFRGRPLYNDVQCGNGPPNDAGDEHSCPGRVDLGPTGCGQIGPKWNLTSFLPPSAPPTAAPTISASPTSSVVPTRLSETNTSLCASYSLCCWFPTLSFC